MDAVTTWLNVAGENAIDSTETAELLAAISRTADSAKRTKLINKVCAGNLKLVYTTVKKYSDKRRLRWGTELSADLLQVGFLGLRHAVDRYDASRGTRISTVAVPWIRQKLGRHLINKENSIRVPENLLKEVYSVKTTGKTTNTRGTPKDKSLITLAAYAHAEPLSLDKPLNDVEDSSTLGDIIEQPSTEGSAAQRDRKVRLLKDLMAQAGIEPRTQDLMVRYARTGVKTTAASQCNIQPQKARILIRETISRLQELV